MVEIRSPRPLHLLKGDPFLPVAWRWRQAKRLLDTGSRITESFADDSISAAVRFQRELAHCVTDADVDRVARRWPHLHQARALAAEGGPRVWEMQARLLAGESDQQIADQLGVEPLTVNSYEQTYFGIRDRVGASCWILVEAIGAPPGGIYPRDLAVLWKTFGYHAGALVLDTIIQVTHPCPERRRRVEPRVELAARMSMAVMTAESDLELAELSALARRVQRIKGLRQGGADETVLRAFAAMNTANSETVPAPGAASATACSLSTEAAANLRELTDLVARLEARAG